MGNRQAVDILLDGLEKLEYRGYDSAGIAVCENGKIKCSKTKGRLENLRAKCAKEEISGNVGIGHTRWATHGEPSDINSHPHMSSDGKFAVVHNGIIENYTKLREFAMKKGCKFVSETDTEVIPNLISLFYKGDLLEAVSEAAKMLIGSYAFCVVSTLEPGKIVAVRKDSPLIVGVKEGEVFIASDIPAVLKETREIYLLEDNEFVLVQGGNVKIYDADKHQISRETYTVTFDESAAEKAGYDHFMLKEIYEQPRAVKDTLAGRISLGSEVNFYGADADLIKDVEKIYIVACGTAYHAGLVGKTAIEQLCSIPVEVDIASEFRYRHPIIDEKTLLIVISQSGETADTLAALRLAKKRGAKCVAITNVVGSTISREADKTFFTHAGPEIAVASTKAYTTQLIALYIFALFVAEKKQSVLQSEINIYKKDLLALVENLEKALECDETVKEIAKDLAKKDDVFFLGRGLDYAVAMEGALKLKEISYIHAEAYAGGELKHGPIALIEKETPVICISSNSLLKAKMDSNVRETAARGAYVIGVQPWGVSNEGIDTLCEIPRVNEMFSPVLSVIPLQLLAYYVAVEKGCDVDKPRNLAKSVTVE